MNDCSVLIDSRSLHRDKHSALLNAQHRHDGFVAIVLHAHLPYVKQPSDFLTIEEKWYYEALVDVYLPLIEMCVHLIQANVSIRLTLSLSPTLLAMLDDEEMKRRARLYVARLVELSEKEVIRLHAQPALLVTAEHYAKRYKQLLVLYDDLQCDLIRRFADLQKQGLLELMVCAATHAFLPLCKNTEILHMQLDAALTEFQRHFDCMPAGIWLPECGYSPEIERHLQALGVRYILIDDQALRAATDRVHAPHPHPHDINLDPTLLHPEPYSHRPVWTPSGTAAFARDREASEHVWNAHDGYPSDPLYREYYRDIGFDLGQDDSDEFNYIKPFLLLDEIRTHIGFKYFRITGATEQKQPYDQGKAAYQAEQHAEHFVRACAKQLRHLSQTRDTPYPPISICCFDAELFGHWWYEGPTWLEAVLQKLQHQSGISSIHVSEYLQQYPPQYQATLPLSSWGRGGYSDVWLQPKTAWIYPRLHAAEDRMIHIARSYLNSSMITSVKHRMIHQAARELMLAQSSDWAFMMDAGTFTSYAQQRITTHLHQFHQLLDVVTDTDVLLEENEAWLSLLEQHASILPDLSLASLLPQNVPGPQVISGQLAFAQELHLQIQSTEKSRCILILTWEYPPHITGGLGVAVYDQSRQLAEHGHRVHIITCACIDVPAYEFVAGVHVHRVSLLPSMPPVLFMDWVFQMNIAIADFVVDILSPQIHIDLIHAHDWLVYNAAIELQQSLQLPLITTIHATESGRFSNQLHTSLQQRIHQFEYALTHASDALITCSYAMQDEVMQLFSIPESAITVIPNGITCPKDRTQLLSASTFFDMSPDTLPPSRALEEAFASHVHQPLLCFLGRLVPEKGVHILLEALSLLITDFPHIQLIIAGIGPIGEQLQQLALPLGKHVHFVGFLQAVDKFQLLQRADICVIPSLYEPFGMVCLEAMSCGTPVVASRVGGLQEIIEDGVTGILVPPQNSDELARSLIDLLQHPQQQIVLAQAAIVHLQQNYNLCGIATRIEDVYQKNL